MCMHALHRQLLVPAGADRQGAGGGLPPAHLCVLCCESEGNSTCSFCCTMTAAGARREGPVRGAPRAQLGTPGVVGALESSALLTQEVGEGQAGGEALDLPLAGAVMVADERLLHPLVLRAVHLAELAGPGPGRPPAPAARLQAAGLSTGRLRLRPRHDALRSWRPAARASGTAAVKSCCRPRNAGLGPCARRALLAPMSRLLGTRALGPRCCVR